MAVVSTLSGCTLRAVPLFSKASVVQVAIQEKGVVVYFIRCNYTLSSNHRPRVHDIAVTGNCLLWDGESTVLLHAACVGSMMHSI